MPTSAWRPSPPTSSLPRAEPVILNPQIQYNGDLLNQYTVTDLHFGSLSRREETGTDYDLKIAEQLLLDWFAAAIQMSPNAHTAVLAQLGDLLHFDSLEAVTPTSRHVIDADSRFAKIVRIVIRTMRRIVAMLLEKHQHVHIIMADANHDPASEIWLREMFAAFYEHEPRLTIEKSPSTYYAYEWGDGGAVLSPWSPPEAEACRRCLCRHSASCMGGPGSPMRTSAISTPTNCNRPI
jgi:hypothetical protein